MEKSSDERMTWTIPDMKRLFPNAVNRATDTIIIPADSERKGRKLVEEQK